MIFDWLKNCEDIYNTLHFPNEDAQERKTMLFQHIMFFKYLEENKKMTREEVKCYWLTTDSVYLKNIPDEDSQEWIEIEFSKLWNMRNKNKINFLDTNHMVYNFPIYQQEIDYINSLDCSCWYKKALLLMLGCAKHNKSGLLKYNYTTTAWIERVIDPTKKVRDKMKNIGMLNLKYHLFDFVNFGSNANYIKMTFMKTKGNIVSVVYSPNAMQECLNLIQEDSKVCGSCGKEFIPSTKSQTDLCPDCYKEYRHKYQVSNNNRRRHEKKDK